MRARKAALGLAALATAGLAIGLLLQQRRLERLRAQNEALRVQVSELAALQAESQQRAGLPDGVPEKARLRDQQAELLRLRGEVTRLRNEARQNAARGASSSQPPAVAAPAASQNETNPAPFIAAATVSVGSGETFATGGWLTSPGSRTFLLATPKLGEGAAGGKAVNVAMCLLKVAEGDLPESLLSKLQSQAPADSPVLTGPEAAFLKSKLGSADETNIVSRPFIATSDGVPASLFVGESRPNPDGTQRQVGTKIDLSPQVAQDGQTIKMGVNLEYVPLAGKDGDEAPARAN
jgi:hypothetical protein